MQLIAFHGRWWHGLGADAFLSAILARGQKRACGGRFFYYLRFGFCRSSIVNQKNTIKSMIPQRLLELIPSSMRDNWANQIVEAFKEHNPALYQSMEQWSLIPDDKKEVVVSEILSAAEQIHWQIQDEN